MTIGMKQFQTFRDQNRCSKKVEIKLKTGSKCTDQKFTFANLNEFQYIRRKGIKKLKMLVIIDSKIT